MSNIDINTLNTPEGFKAFLREYHAMLHQARSFPPLGLQKALHTAAPIFGYSNWHVMAAALSGVQPATPTEEDLDALALQHRIEFTDLGDEWGWRSLAETVDSPSGWPTKREAWENACAYYDIEIKTPTPASGRMSDLELEGLAHHYGFKFNDLGEGLWDWSTLDGDIESEQAWATKQEAWEDLCESQGIDSRSLANIAAAARHLATPAAPVEPERIHVITVTVTTKSTDHETIESVDTDVVRSWVAAKESVADRVRAKVTYNDRDMEEVLENCTSITLPDEDERDALEDDDAVLEWLIEHNDIDELCTLLSYLDYDLTTVYTSETWI